MFENSNLNKPQKRLWICIYLFLLWVFITLKCRLLAMEQLKMLPLSQNSSEIQHNRRIVKNGCHKIGIHFSSGDNVLLAQVQKYVFR